MDSQELQASSVLMLTRTDYPEAQVKWVQQRHLHTQADCSKDARAPQRAPPLSNALLHSHLPRVRSCGVSLGRAALEGTGPAQTPVPSSHSLAGDRASCRLSKDSPPPTSTFSSAAAGWTGVKYRENG